MTKNRIEAFSDGVIAIIVTIMVLELKAPHGAELSDLANLLPIFLGYVVSFLYVAIYWNNHHHMFHTVKHITGSSMWANMHLLFWLSLLPFVSAWASENHFSAVPMALYGIVLFMAAIAYTILTKTLVAHESNILLKQALGDDFKGKLSLVLYALGVATSFLHPIIPQFLYTLVAIMWLIPDRRIEKVL